VTFFLWAASGAMQAYIVPAIAVFNLAVPHESRGRAVGLAAAGLALSQGISLAVGGVIAGAVGPAAAVAWFGVAGLVGLAVLRPFWPYQALGLVADNVLSPLHPIDELAASDELAPAAPTAETARAGPA
jgi:MFS family permease